MSKVDTGEFDLDFLTLDALEHEVAKTPALIVDVIDDDQPELDEGDVVFVGWSKDI